MLSPSIATSDTVPTASTIAAISNGLKSSDIGDPSVPETSTSRGATIKAICALLPTEISIASVMSLRADAAIGLSVATVSLVAIDGESNWLEGLQLLGLYVILSAAFYFIPA